MASSPLLVVVLLSVLSLCLVNGQTTFNFIQQPQMNQTIYGRVASQMASLVAPVVWEMNQQQTQVAQLTSWLLWGTQPDVDITLNSGLNFTTIAGSSAGFTYLGNVDFENDFGYAYGGNGCQHRNTFNRFYWMGNTSGTVYNWASADGSTWLQILDPATTTAWSSRTDFSFTGCLVTAQDVVVSLGAIDIYQSTNLGVTFTLVTPQVPYPPRQYFGSGIYSPIGGTADVMVVAGGRGYINGTNPYGGLDFNDVWTSSNLGLSWSPVCNAAPWSPRDSLGFAISSTGVFVMQGGSIYGGYGGWLGDVWTSVNGGFNWVQLATSTNAGTCSQSTLLFDANGYLYLFFGQYPGYKWLTQAFKSSQTFANIQTWGPQVNSSMSFPSTFPLAINSSATTFVTPAFQTYAQKVQSQCSAPSTTLPTASAGAKFTYVQQPNAAVYSRAESTIAPITVPMTYPLVYQANQAIDWAVAPSGSWLLWGAQQDVSVSTNYGQTWNLISGVTYAGLPAPAITDFGFTYGADQCQHRNTFNRFYVIGNGSSGATNQPFYVWASNNGWEWINVIDSGTKAAFANRPNVDFAACLVDIRNRVYSVGGSDVWVSTNLGVTFTNLSSSSLYTPRTSFGSGIFTNSSRGDVMFVLAGRVPPSAASPYGGSDLNDVWISTTYGYSWTQVSASAPWSARDSVNVAVSAYGVIALYGGSYYGGSAGWLDDTWVSLDGGYLWVQLAGTGQLNNRSQASILFDNLGYLNVWFGQAAPDYNWSTDGWKSAYSFNNIQQWGPNINSAFSLTTLSPGYSACAPINYQVPPSGLSSSSSSSSISSGAIAGAVIGSVVGALLIVCLLLCFCGVFGGAARRSKKDTNTEPSSGAGRFSNVEEGSQVSNTNDEVEMH